MKPKSKKNKLPQSAWVLYLKLYSERKGSFKNENILVEATKSWLSLSESERQQFNAKFEEYKQKYIQQSFEQLKNAKPFMKIKNVGRTKNIKSNNRNLEPDGQIEDLISESVPIEIAPHIDTTAQIETTTQIKTTREQISFKESSPQPASPSVFEDVLQEDDILEASIHNNDDVVSQTVLIEPVAPTIKSGHELFLMLSSTNEDNNAWASLPPIEKNRYSRAVSIMKKDYISKYKEYLESLSSKELFHYYNKTIF